MGELLTTQLRTPAASPPLALFPRTPLPFGCSLSFAALAVLATGTTTRPVKICASKFEEFWPNTCHWKTKMVTAVTQWNLECPRAIVSHFSLRLERVRILLLFGRRRDK